MIQYSKKKYKIPSLSALIAFESAARHLNFSLAAEELNTSQSAISRHIQGIEQRFGTLLFDRSKRKHHRLMLSSHGEHFYRAVVNNLDGLHQAAQLLEQAQESDQLIISCTHEASHLFLMPRFEALQERLGADTPIKIIISEYASMQSALDPRTDLSFITTKEKYISNKPSHTNLYSTAGEATLIFKEEIQPICSPAYYHNHEKVLQKPMGEWQDLHFLQLTKKGRGGANWSDWKDYFLARNITQLNPKFLPYYNYVYLLEAASAGRGIALGWRFLIDRHLDDGVLITLTEKYTKFENGFYGLVTEKGRQHPKAQICLDFLCDDISGQ